MNRVLQKFCVVHTAMILISAAPVSAAEPGSPTELPTRESVRPQLVCTGYAFAEGPAIDAEGNLYVVNYREWGTIGKFSPDGTAKILIDLRQHLPADGDRLPSCNGLKIDDDGNLVGAETGTSQIVRIPRDGSRVEVLVREVAGQRLDGLNDLALDGHGNIYFANPGQQNIYRWNESDGSVDRINPEPIGSNGIGITPDGMHVITADSGGMRLMIVDLEDGKGLRQRELVSFKPPSTPDPLPSGEFEQLAEDVGVPDGFVFDAAGRLYVGMWTGKVVHCIEVPSGKILATYDAGGSQATNVHFYEGDLYVTVAAKEAVFKLPLGIEGWRYSRACGY